MPQPFLKPTCDGLIVSVAVRERSHKRALTLANKVVRRNLRGRWRVTPLASRSRDFEVVRTGKRKTIPVGTAWNYTHKLKTDRDVVSAEPMLTTCGLEPATRHAARQLTTAEAVPVPKSSGGEKHKACSTAHDWSLQSAKIIDAWALPLPSHGHAKRFGAGIIVGHPDTGYTLHPEIWNNPGGFQRVRSHSGYDFVLDKKYPVDPLVGEHPSHGTKTGSVIMSDDGPRDPNHPWMSGAAPLALLVPYRVITNVIVMNFKNVTRAIYKAADSGCHVISMSLGGPLASDALGNAVQYAIDRGVIVLAAAGNIWPWVVYPAKLDTVIAVAATNCERKPWKNSARGEAVDVSAPGESVWRAETTKEAVPFKWGRGTGTSFAVATTAGTCALWLAWHGRDRLITKYGRENLASVFKELLMTKGIDRPAGWDTSKYGAGILNAKKLLEAPLPDTPHAKGVKALSKRARRDGAAPAGADALASIRDFFPRVTPGSVRAALVKLLRTKDEQLDELLQRIGDEVVFHIATNRDLRESLHNRIIGARTKSKGRNTQLTAQASHVLKKQLNR